jgi:pimeloyl-CoA synthetase
MNEKHIEKTLTKVVEKILIKHNIQAQILAITIDNASNNIIFFFLFVKNLSIITNCVDVMIENENEDDEKTMNQEKIQNIVHVSCLAHVLQLALQTFLRSVRVNSINDELQKN